MNCQDFEPFVFTYTELSPEEKQSVDAHLQTCAHCRALLAEVTHVQKAIRLVAAEEVKPPHAAQLTARIMAQTGSGAKRNWMKEVEEFLQHAFVRYSLATASCMLLLVLATELFSDETQSSFSSQRVQAGVMLDTQRFRESFMKSKRQLADYDCHSPFKSVSEALNCMKEKWK
jgi:hypothetical protein